MTKDTFYTVRAGYKFQAIEDGSRVDKGPGEKVKNLTEDQRKAFGDVFEETFYGGEKASYVSDTPDGNPDTTKVVTEGLEDAVASPTIGPAEAGQSPPVVPGSPQADEQVEAEPVADKTQGGGNSTTSESSSVQSTAAPAATTAAPTTTAAPAATTPAPAATGTKPADKPAESK